jgi:hypothetical protein
MSYDVKRIAIFGMMPVRTAPKPLYRPSGVSRLTISLPVVKKPRRLACTTQVKIGDHVAREDKSHTPGARARRESCIRTLMVSLAQYKQCHET